MKTTIRKFMLVLVIASVLLGSTLAGTLDPPGPPAPTMATLQQIYDKLGGLGVANVARTGQSECWDEFATVSNCAGTGQDGALLKGVSVSPRFTGNGDGTVKDNLTGLIWLKDAYCFGDTTWTNALSNANTLASPSCGLSDGSLEGNWRLPNIKELKSLLDYGNVNPALPAGHPFAGVQFLSFYWSSSTYAGNPDRSLAWGAFLFDGHIGNVNKTFGYPVWPVRGGQ